jgi:hypothetical protein
VILHETVPLALAQPIPPSGERPTVHVWARPRTGWIRRELATSASGRAWLLELEVEVPEIDPEQLLADCEHFLVDGKDGRRIGVVEEVEKSGAAGAVSALIVSTAAFGRRRRRIDAQAIEALVPEERRVIVDESLLASAGDRTRS